jgi:hypothetical protein
MCFVGDDLLAGRLILLLEDHASFGDSMYLVTRPSCARRKEYKAFHDWFVRELDLYWAKLRDAYSCAEAASVEGRPVASVSGRQERRVAPVQ